MKDRSRTLSKRSVAAAPTALVLSLLLFALSVSTVEAAGDIDGYYEGIAESRMQASSNCRIENPFRYLSVKDKEIRWFDGTKMIVADDGTFGSTDTRMTNRGKISTTITGNVEDHKLVVTIANPFCKTEFRLRYMTPNVITATADPATGRKYDGVYTGVADLISVAAGMSATDCPKLRRNRRLVIRDGVASWRWGEFGGLMHFAINPDGSFASKMGIFFVDGKISDGRFTARQGNYPVCAYRYVVDLTED